VAGQDKVPHREIVLGNRGQAFQYGLNRMGSASDDEIELKNSVTVDPNGRKNSSVETVSQIAAKSSVVQASLAKPPS